ncbi:MAG: hypothetical protein R3275_03085 [Saprospiraceae bacterium]|nr:hypothetical protein [Saprospiraceae bacterium]
MKKLFIIALALGLTSAAYSQKVGFWFDAGLKAGGGPTLMLNSNIFDDDLYDHQISSGFSVGGKLGIFYGLYNGINFDVMLSQGNQKFRNEINSDHVEHKVTWTTTDLAVLYRLQKEGIYVELGPMFSFVSSVKQDGFNPEDVSEFYNENLTSGVFGFGGYLLSGDQFTLMFGLRAGYTFTDMINDTGQALNYPRANSPQSSLEGYDTYEETNPIFVQIMLEANFGIGYFAKTACAHRTSFFRF